MTPWPPRNRSTLTVTRSRPMHQSVADAFASFTAQFEGTCTWMYLDVRGLVTTGRGNLIDSPGAACALPWIDSTGLPAKHQDVDAEWRRIKSLQSMSNRGGGAFAQFCTLRLPPGAVDALTATKRDEMWVSLLARFPDADTWPADAQLGLLSMAWAMGPAFDFPVFRSCASTHDWAGAARECTINEVGNPGLVPRNVANRRLFANAAALGNLDPAALYYPRDLTQQA